MSNEAAGEVELVATLPQGVAIAFTSRLGIRTTLGVLTELLAGAQHHVVISAPFIQGAEALHVGPIGNALVAALERGVRVDLISTSASLANIDLQRLRELSSSGFRALRPKRNVDDQRFIGSHAKFCLSDDARAYVGSANITQPGINANLELGVLLHRDPARRLAKFVRKLIQSGYFVNA